MYTLNVFHTKYYSWKCPSQWFKNIKLFFRQFKYAWQRITRGFCDADTWDLKDYYTNLFHATLTYFANNLHDAPYNFFDEELEVGPWQDYLLEMARHFYNADSSNGVIENEYEEAHLLNLDNEELSKQYVARENEIVKWRSKELKKGLDMLQEVYEDLWD